MGAGIYGGFGNTNGSYKEIEKAKIAKVYPIKVAKKIKRKDPIFSSNGHVTEKSITNRAEFFLGKSVARLEHELKKRGYETTRRPSKHSTSKAKIIVTTNPSKERNISQIQVSPGSKRHGNVPYVKISTSDIGLFKIIGASEHEYKSDGKETAKLLFRRKKK